jgi:hypothetical protein
MAEDDPSVAYEVLLTKPAEIEIEQEHSRLADAVSAEYAQRWQDGLLADLERLHLFPTRHAVAPENDLYDVVVRRMLYYGPSRRRGNLAYRILFHVMEPTAGEEMGIVRILHVWHGARKPGAEE